MCFTLIKTVMVDWALKTHTKKKQLSVCLPLDDGGLLSHVAVLLITAFLCMGRVTPDCTQNMVSATDH